MRSYALRVELIGYPFNSYFYFGDLFCVVLRSLLEEHQDGLHVVSLHVEVMFHKASLLLTQILWWQRMRS